MEKLLFTNSGDLIIAGFHAVRIKLNLLLYCLHCVVKMHRIFTERYSSNE